MIKMKEKVKTVRFKQNFSFSVVILGRLCCFANQELMQNQQLPLFSLSY